MTLTPTNCIESNMVFAGGSALSDSCVIDVIRVIDTHHVEVKVYPLYEGAITLVMTEGQPYNFIEFQRPFRVTPMSVFYGLRKAANFKMCDLTQPLEPTLAVDYVIAELSPAGDLPAYNRYGVYFEVHVVGTGKGILKISWGNDHSETQTNVVAGNYAFTYNLPPGTHNVCAELFNVTL